jgi:hypothetical protein
MGAELRQGEILSDIAQFTYDPVTTSVSKVVVPYCIIAAQDCDLLWDFQSRGERNQGTLNQVLMFEAVPAADARKKISGSDIWKRIRQNNDERYQALQAVPAALDLTSAGVPDLIVDFKAYFTMPPEHLYWQLGQQDGAKRRARLEVPYKEQIQYRAGYYLCRIGVPAPHQIAG